MGLGSSWLLPAVRNLAAFPLLFPRDAQRGCGSHGLLEPCSPFLRAARLLEGLVSLAHRLSFSATAFRPTPSVGSRPAVAGDTTGWGHPNAPRSFPHSNDTYPGPE